LDVTWCLVDMISTLQMEAAGRSETFVSYYTKLKLRLRLD